jgi:phosphopantetheine--protein transferase-like protein
LIGHLLPCALLAAHSVDLSSVRIKKGRHGRPYVDLTNPAISFEYNISHDSKWIVCAYQFGSTEDALPPVGVDVVDCQAPWKGATARDFQETFSDLMSPQERQSCSVLTSNEDKMAYLTRLWAHKEAWSKACGMGLHDGWSDVTITLNAKRLQFHQAGQLRPEWRFSEYSPCPDHLIVVACENELPELPVTTFTFDELMERWTSTRA